MATVLRMLALCRKIQSVPDETLRELDRTSLLVVKLELQALDREIELILARLKFLDDLHPN
jgi:hypothetical protein